MDETVTTTENKKPTILVVGDLIIDRTVHTRALGLSLESPTMKVQHLRTEEVPGGAANVVFALTQKLNNKNVFFYTDEGNINDTRDQYQFEHYLGLNSDTYWFSDHLEKTTTKERIYVSHGDNTYKYLQITHSSVKSNGGEIRNEQRIIKLFEILERKNNIPKCIVLSDYGTELLIPIVVTRIAEFAKKHKIPVLAAAQYALNSYIFEQESFIPVLNNREYGQYIAFASSRRYEDDDEPFENNSEVIVTSGKDGAWLPKSNVRVKPSEVIENPKTTIGAGDYFLAGLASRVALGEDLQMATKFAVEFAKDYVKGSL